jgi:hypothetical protein
MIFNELAAIKKGAKGFFYAFYKDKYYLHKKNRGHF